MTASTTTDGAAVRVRRTPDARTYWRVALAMIAPVPWAAMGLVNVLQPFAGDEEFGSTVEKVRDNLDLVLATITRHATPPTARRGRDRFRLPH